MQNDFMTHLIKYGTARIDIKNKGNKDNSIEIIEIDGPTLEITHPAWLKNDEGTGTIIQSNFGSLDMKFRCVNSGILHFWLRGIDYKDRNNKKFPIYIDYIDFKLNGENIFNENKVVWHDVPFVFKKNVGNGEIIKIHIEWLPFNYHTSYYEENISQNNKKMEDFEEKLAIREKQIKSIPQLSVTSLGKSTLGGKLVYRNWLGSKSFRTLMNDFEGFCEREWFTKYLSHKFPNEDFKIYMYGVFNPHDNIAYPTEGKKVLYSAEDLNYRFLEMKTHFDKYALDYVDLAIGFDLIGNPRYIRFPYWLRTHFSPYVTEEEIENKVAFWKSVNYEKSREITAIASHDFWGTRTLVDNDIKDFVNVDYAGKWKNNTQELHNKFNNNKMEYLKRYKFNLCAENVLSDAYVTEKIFDAINCDCIPLYAGGGSYLEPEVVNPKVVIRWDGDPVIGSNSENMRRAYYGYDSHENVKWICDDDRNSDSIELFKNLLTDEKSYREFKDNDKILDSSVRFIINKFKELEKQFERLIYN